MDKTIDMTYSFLRDEEPSDEQLRVLMQEVGESARRVQKEVAGKVIENIRRESARLHAAQQSQQR